MVAIADPLTTRLASGVYTRTVFPGNVVPPSRFSKIASQLRPGMAHAKRGGSAVHQPQQLLDIRRRRQQRTPVRHKIDHNMNSRWKFYGHGPISRATASASIRSRYKVNLTRPNENHIYNATVAANAVFSPTLVAEFHSGFARSVSDSIPYAVTQGFDMRTLGFPNPYYNAVQ